MNISEQIRKEDEQQSQYRPGKYRVLVIGNTVYVKDAKYFEEQGGLIESWGKRWIEIEADSINHAREKAREWSH